MRDFYLLLVGCMAERLKNKFLEADKSVDLVAGPGKGLID